MGIKKLTPTSAARRFQTYLTRDEITTDKPYEPLLEPKKRISRPQQRRPHHDAPARRRGKAALSHHRFQARQDGHPGEGRHRRVRSESLGAHRVASLCWTARNDTSSRRSV